VVGPDDVLAAGIVDRFEIAGLRIFGPCKEAARLESSKSYAKQFMVRHGIPTARFGEFESSPEAKRALSEFGFPLAVKADGLALGKGVVIAQDRHQAENAIEDMIERGRYGEAGRKVVVEEFLSGAECSVHALVDGRSYLLFPTAQDHKQLYDGNRGPNTGGMGAYSPAPMITPTLHARIMREVINPAINGIEQEGESYTGFLYAGLMIMPDGSVKVLEFNCRMGDPETEVIMMRLKSSLVSLLEHALNGTLDKVEAEWDRRTALGAVMAAHGYPEAPRKGDVIHGLAELPVMPVKEKDYHVFHAGTAMDGENGNEIVTAGGRVLCVTALGDSVKMAQRRVYDIAEQIHFNGCQMRHDIGYRAINHRK